MTLIGSDAVRSSQGQLVLHILKLKYNVIIIIMITGFVMLGKIDDHFNFPT